jgi:hypothetical protein
VPRPAPAATAIELPAPQFWPLGFGTHKQATTVKQRMQSICLDGHDLARSAPRRRHRALASRLDLRPGALRGLSVALHDGRRERIVVA